MYFYQWYRLQLDKVIARCLATLMHVILELCVKVKGFVRYLQTFEAYCNLFVYAL